MLTALALAAPPPDARGQIEWRNQGCQALPQMSPGQAANVLREMVESDQRRHCLVKFSASVGPDDRERMKSGGVELLASVGDNAFFAAIDEPRLSVARLGAVRTLRSAAAIDRHVKLHPMLAQGQVPTWAVVAHVGLRAGNAEPVIGAYVLFHRDVDLLSASAFTLGRGAIVRDELESINGLVIEIPITSIPLLADVDAVQWIEPALPPFSELNDSNRVITEVDDVQAPPFNLDGSGVTVLVYDGGTARATHNDFSGRLTVHDGSGLSHHATHVSATVGGDGSASGGLFRGMAPAVDLLSYGFQWNGQEIFLYSNPGDLEDDYAEAINALGADVANNSIGTNTETNGWPCSIQGDYGVTSVLIDTIVRGDGSNPLFSEPFRIIWAGGNERQGSTCDIEGFGDYYSTAPPAGAKNHIAIGALNSNNDSMTSFSSWGPVDDGRIKPDVCGPGCQSNGDFAVTSAHGASDTAYGIACGTSMSSPTVTGLTALLLEDFRAQFPGRPDPRNSTVKTLLANTAQDRGNPGPDYQFGYGSVRIQAAIELMRSAEFAEGLINQGETHLFSVQIDPGTPELKVTLAWDDVPGTPNVDPALVNDLDLRVSGPGGTFLPWTLDPLDPGAGAVQNQADHTNNIEQVLIASPASGSWTVEVTGFNVPQGPQPFSLAGAGAATIVVDVALSPTVQSPLTRCITFELFNCAGDSVVVRRELTFTDGLASDVTLLVPPDDYQCMTARDGKHTLRRTDDSFRKSDCCVDHGAAGCDDPGCEAAVCGVDAFCCLSGWDETCAAQASALCGNLCATYTASFTDKSGTGGDNDALIGGNLNDDDFIDIIDFGLFAGQFNTNVGGSDCSTTAPHADVSGNGMVFTEDFTFIQINFLQERDANCCGAPGFAVAGGAQPVTTISLEELQDRGLGHLAVADLNGDGWLDQLDIGAFMNGARPQEQPPVRDPAPARAKTPD